MENFFVVYIGHILKEVNQYVDFLVKLGFTILCSSLHDVIRLLSNDLTCDFNFT